MSLHHKLDRTPFLTDGGMETVFIFKRGIHLPHFAALELMDRRDGERLLREYFEDYIRVAESAGMGLVFETPTWRGNPDWGARLGYGPTGLRRVNRAAAEFAVRLAADHAHRLPATLVSGVVGPRGDGYRTDVSMGVAEACAYHRPQIEALAAGGCEVITAYTLTEVGEAAGIAYAARDVGIGCALSFTVETDGRLPSGTPLGEAVQMVDAAPDGSPLYYMVNCAHPSHILGALPERAPWLERIRGVRVNASRCSHAELDNATTLDEGNPTELAGHFDVLRERLPRLAIHGGCCGTDHAHLGAIARAVGGAAVNV